MNELEREQLIGWANNLTDAELEKEYYRAVEDAIGSEAEIMYECGYDMQDILEREKLERWLGEKADLLEELCNRRGIKLWEEY